MNDEAAQLKYAAAMREALLAFLNEMDADGAARLTWARENWPELTRIYNAAMDALYCRPR